MGIVEQVEAAFGGRLTVERELGGGGMSRVFLAREKHPARMVVVKVLPPELVRDASAERFRREMDVAGALTHPHIVALLYPGQSDDLLAYAMPFIEGESLRARLGTGPLPIAEAVRLWRELLDALAYAHEHGVVHRDVKPENILLAGRHAMVTDFGVAKALSEATGADRVTSTGLALGTPAYMAPEQAAGDAGTDHRADLYAAGLVMWEMLVGRHPYAGMTPSQMMVAHATRTPEPLPTARASTPPALATLVERCLAKEPADRPQHAEEVLAALESIQLSDPTPLASPAAQESTASTLKALPVASAPGWRRIMTTRRVIGIAAVTAAAGAAVVMQKRPVAPATAAGVAAAVQTIVVIPNAIDPADSLLRRGLLQLVAGELETIPGSGVLVPGQALADVAQRNWGMSAAAVADPDTLRMLARRGATAVMVLLDITRVGSGRNLSAAVETSRGGTLLARLTESANDEGELLEAGRRLARAIRARLADTLALIQPAAATGIFTTVSTAAVDQIRRGFNRFTVGDLLAAMEHYRVAIQLDPGFAWGHRQIAVSYNNLGIRRSSAIDAISRARELAVGSRPYERRLIEGLYFTLLAMDDSAFAFYGEALKLNPRNTTLINNFSLAHFERREFRAAEERLREGLGISGLGVWTAHTNLGVATAALGRTGVTDSMLANNTELAQSLRGTQLRRGASIARLDYAAAAALDKASAGRDTTLDSRLDRLRTQFDVLAALGQHQAAAGASRDLEALLDSLGAPGDALGAALQRLQLAALFSSSPRDVSGELDVLLRRYPLRDLHPLDRPYPQLVATAAALGRVEDAGRWTAEQQETVASRWPGIDRHEMNAARALTAAADRRGEDAVRFAIAGDSGECVPCTAPALALAYSATGDTVRADRQWRTYLETSSFDRAEADRYYLAYALRELGRLAEARRDEQAALRYYDQLLTLWKDADEEGQRWLEPVRTRVSAIRRRQG